MFLFSYLFDKSNLIVIHLIVFMNLVNLLIIFLARVC